MSAHSKSTQHVKRSLQEIAEQFHTLYRYMPIPSLTWQKKGREFVLVNYNNAADEFTDGLIARYIGRKASHLYKDRPDIRRDMARSFRTRGIVNRETPYRMFTKGVDKFIAFTFAYIPPDFVLTHMEDNTVRRRTEEKLLRSERNLRTLSVRLLNAGELERKRIAGELHDSIGQYLTTLKFNAENSLGMLRKKHPDAAAKLLEEEIPLIQQTMEEVRRIMMALRPTILDDLGLLATLSWFCREFQATHESMRLVPEISLRESDVPDHLKIIIYRIIQESTNNAATHSRAHEVRLKLALKKKRIELIVEDDGVGFDMDAVMARRDAHHGLGLLSMRERAELAGGRLSVESTPGKGTIIRALWQAEAG